MNEIIWMMVYSVFNSVVAYDVSFNKNSNEMKRQSRGNDVDEGNDDDQVFL